MPYVDAAGVKLYLEEAGQGYPIIFVHEFGSDLRAWQDQVGHFSRSYRCITFNARGYPPSDVPDDAAMYSWEIAIDDIAAVMTGLSIERAHLVGLSMGGYAALQFGLRYPERTSAVVAAGTGSGSMHSQRDVWVRQSRILARAFGERGMDAMASQMARHPMRNGLKRKRPEAWQRFVERLSQHSAIGMSHTMARCLALRPSLHELRDQFAELTTPVLLAVGEDDESCRAANQMLHSMLPAAGLWICPKAGHAINLEEPAPFNLQVEGFLRSVELGGWCRALPNAELSPTTQRETAASLLVSGAQP